VTTCPRCGELVAPQQEYCLGCGARLPGATAMSATDAGRGWVLRALVALAVALAGTVAAVAATGGTKDRAQVVTATGGFATVPTSSTLPSPTDPGPTGIVDWPAGEDGWTISLASLPQTGGRRAAEARAREARKAGLAPVGVLDSSRYASLHPGYWVVFTGVYTSEAEATSALEPARRVARTAAVRRIIS
jgi:hypothetical protein